MDRDGAIAANGYVAQSQSGDQRRKQRDAHEIDHVGLLPYEVVDCPQAAQTYGHPE
jgi:hypothetical protein